MAYHGTHGLHELVPHPASRTLGSASASLSGATAIAPEVALTCSTERAPGITAVTGWSRIHRRLNWPNGAAAAADAACTFLELVDRRERDLAQLLAEARPRLALVEAGARHVEDAVVAGVEPGGVLLRHLARQQPDAYGTRMSVPTLAAAAAARPSRPACGAAG